MGKVKGGIQGKVSGKVGNVVYYESGDKQLVRTAPSGSRKFSTAQKGNQTSFGIKQAWLNPISGFLKVGCRNNIPFMGGPALAMKYISANAVSGEGGNTVVQPENVLVSMGDLAGTASASALLDGQEVVFDWDPAVGINGSPFDQALLLAYNVELEHAYYQIKGTFRKEGSARLPIQEPGNYHCYLGFVAEDSSQQSDSIYLGMVVK